MNGVALTVSAVTALSAPRTEKTDFAYFSASRAGESGIVVAIGGHPPDSGFRRVRRARGS
jgi:hypothetical protein